MKQCNRCKRTLPDEEFSIKRGRPGQKDILRSRCKECTRIIHRERYNKKPRNRSQRKSSPGIASRKKCCCCGEAKEISQFHRECKSPTKLWHWSSRCKQCSSFYQSQKYNRRKYVRPSLLTPEGKILNRKYKHVSGGYYHTPHRKILFNLSLSDVRHLVEQQTLDGKLLCAISGLELEIDEYSPLRASLDRIDNNGGYVKDNVRLVCLLYNLLRNRWSDAQIRDAVNDFLPDLDFTRIIRAYIGAHKVMDGVYTNPCGRSYDFTITENDIFRLIGLQTIDGRLKCDLSGVDISNIKGSPAYLSIDRIDNKMGYVPGNIAITTRMANLGRNRWRRDEFKLAWESIRQRLSDNRVRFIWPANNEFKCSHAPSKIAKLPGDLRAQAIEDFITLTLASEWVPPQYSQADLLCDWQNLLGFNDNLYNTAEGFKLNVCGGREFPGKKIILHFQPHFWLPVAKKWHDHKSIKRAAKALLTSGDSINLNRYLRELKHGGVSTHSHFHPNFAIAVLKRLCAKAESWFDPCMGWGGRMLAAKALNMRYVGCEPNVATYDGLRAMRSFINSSFTLEHCRIEDYVPNERYDVGFTSPPFFNKEDYGNRAHRRYGTWLEDFLYPMIDKMLQCCGTTILHLSHKIAEDVRGPYRTMRYPLQQQGHGKKWPEYIVHFMS